MKHIAGLFYTLLFLDCCGGLALHIFQRHWLTAVGAACGIVWSGGNAYLWSRR